MINKSLLRKVMEHIEAHPDEWDQEQWAKQNMEQQRQYDDNGVLIDYVWVCRTRYCFAGHAVVMTDHQVNWNDMKAAETTAFLCDGGKEIEYIAQKELGLSDEQADNLFFGGNSMAVLRNYVNILLSLDNTDERMHSCLVQQMKENNFEN